MNTANAFAEHEGRSYSGIDGGRPGCSWATLFFPLWKHHVASEQSRLQGRSAGCGRWHLRPGEDIEDRCRERTEEEMSEMWIHTVRHTSDVFSQEVSASCTLFFSFLWFIHTFYRVIQRSKMSFIKVTSLWITKPAVYVWCRIFAFHLVSSCGWRSVFTHCLVWFRSWTLLHLGKDQAGCCGIDEEVSLCDKPASVVNAYEVWQAGTGWLHWAASLCLDYGCCNSSYKWTFGQDLRLVAFTIKGKGISNRSEVKEWNRIVLGFQAECGKGAFVFNSLVAVRLWVETLDWWHSLFILQC